MGIRRRQGRKGRNQGAVLVTPHDIFMEVTHEYPDITVHLTLFECTMSQGEPQLLEHNALTWITPAQIPRYDFCPADVEILKKLQNGKR